MSRRDRSYSETVDALSLDFLSLHQDQLSNEDSDSTMPDGDLLLEGGSVIHITSPELKTISPVMDDDELSVSLGKIGFASEFRCDSAGKSSCSSGSNISTPTSSNFDPTVPDFIPRGTSSNGTKHRPQFNQYQRRSAQGEKAFNAHDKPQPSPGMFRNRPPYSHTLCKKSTRGSCPYGTNCRFGHDGDRYVDSPHVTQRFFGTKHAEQWWEPDGKGGKVIAFGSMADGIRRRRSLDIVTPPPPSVSKGAFRDHSGRGTYGMSKAGSSRSSFGVTNQQPSAGGGDCFSSRGRYFENPGPTNRFSSVPGHQFDPRYGRQYVLAPVGPFGPGFAPQFALPPHPDNQHPGLVSEPFAPGHVNQFAPGMQPTPYAPLNFMHPGPFVGMFTPQGMHTQNPYNQFGEHQEAPPFDKHIHRQPGMATTGR